MSLEPDEDSLCSEDHIHWYQHGKLVLTLDEDLTSKERNHDLLKYMQSVNFYVNCFWISDHGNAHLINLAH
jgi:hypothetical protein